MPQNKLLLKSYLKVIKIPNHRQQIQRWLISINYLGIL